MVIAVTDHGGDQVQVALAIAGYVTDQVQVALVIAGRGAARDHMTALVHVVLAVADCRPGGKDNMDNHIVAFQMNRCNTG